MTRVVKKLGYKDWHKNKMESFYLKPLKTAITKYFNCKQTETATEQTVQPGHRLLETASLFQQRVSGGRVEPDPGGTDSRQSDAGPD